jgi:hypothetical protein
MYYINFAKPKSQASFSSTWQIRLMNQFYTESVVGLIKELSLLNKPEGRPLPVAKLAREFVDPIPFAPLLAPE